MNPKVGFAAVVLVLVAVVAGVWAGGSTGRPLPATVFEWSQEPETNGRITVHVSGWVVNPGLVTVSSEARVAVIVAAAGGALPGARLDAVNLAEMLRDGDHLVIPGPELEPQTGAGGSGNGLVKLNSATADQLEALPGVGPVLAERIVAHREAYGPFRTIEDLLSVSGIGEKKLGSLRDLVTP